MGLSQSLRLSRVIRHADCWFSTYMTKHLLLKLISVRKKKWVTKLTKAAVGGKLKCRTPRSSALQFLLSMKRPGQRALCERLSVPLNSSLPSPNLVPDTVTLKVKSHHRQTSGLWFHCPALLVCSLRYLSAAATSKFFIKIWHFSNGQLFSTKATAILWK